MAEAGQRVRPAQRGAGAGRVRLALMVLLAALCAVGLMLPDAGAQEEEEPPGLGDLLAPLTPDADDPTPSPEPSGEPGAPPDPGAPAEPAPGAPPDGDGAPPPPPEGAPPPEPAPPEADVQGAQIAPRRPTSGSASGPGLQLGTVPGGAADGEMPAGIAAPQVAPPDSGMAVTAPPAAVDGQQVAADEQLAAASGSRPGGPAVPDLGMLGLIALGMLWFERRYRARYRLPPPP